MPLNFDDIKDRIPKELRHQIEGLAGKKKRVKKPEVLPDAPASDPNVPSDWKTCKKHGLYWLGNYQCVYCEDI